MRFGVLREREPGETRVALVPEVIKALVKKGHSVVVERGAGESAYIADDQFTEAGAELASQAADVFEKAGCIVKVAPPSGAELERFRKGQGLICFLWHLRNPELLEKLSKAQVTAFAMDAIPRITRAQSMDALSSQATVAGYKAVLLAATHLPSFFPMLTTAAGTIRPAQGLIIGAGVAGLQAIATARRLGAVVTAFDARPAVKEQVLSLGATFLEADSSGLAEQDKYGYAKEATAEMLAAQRKLIADKAKTCDFVITTAQVPGKRAPLLIEADTVAHMKPGSIIVDLAGETGGNCELTKAATRVTKGFVTIEAPANLPALMPLDSSRMYARNISALVAEITVDPTKNDPKADASGFTLDWANEVFRETCVSHGGEARPGRNAAPKGGVS